MAVYTKSNSNGRFTLKLTVTEDTESISVADNTSIVDFKLELIANTSYHFSDYTITYGVTINGTSVASGSGKKSLAGNSSITLASGSTEPITHNSDGTKTVSLIYYENMDSTSYTAGNLYDDTGSLVLSTIPQASTMTVSQGTIGSTNPTFTISRKSTSFTHTIKYITPGTSTENTIATGVGASYDSWAPPTTLYQYFPNSPYITLSYKVYTYSGGTQVGDPYPATAKVYANETACKPTLNVTVTPTDYSSLTGNSKTIISGISNVAISATVTAKNSATISNVKTNGTALTLSSGTYSKTLSKVTTGTFETIATDSRGYIKSDTNGGASAFTVVPYVDLTVSAQIARTNATSSTVKGTISGNYFNSSFGTNGVSNTLTLTWKYKLRTASSWTTGGTLSATKTNNTYTTNEVTLGTSFDYDKDYDFLFTAVDKIYTSGVSTNAPVNAGIPIFDYGVDSNGNNYFNINGYLYGACAITGAEIPTNEYIDGSRVYRKRINTGTLPNATDKQVSSGLTLSSINIIRIQGSAKATNNTMLPLPFVSVSASNCISVSLQSTGDIQIQSGIDRSNYTQSYVDLYYTKN